ncbi:MAG: tetratricopeptide repeat protein [Bacteroides sp.]|nr:tetratricopeptide repeat protein [Bacteroides sp.]
MPAYMKHICSLLWLLIFAVSCSSPRSNDVLDRADALIESAPDSALTLLDRINCQSLTSPALKARYALLRSMALDKNYIDTTTFDVLQPALDFYPRHGSPDEKLRTYYYQGRIYQNRGDRDSALNSFVRAIQLAPQCHDSMVIARAYEGQSHIYNDYFDHEGFIDSQLKAAQIYNKLGQDEYEFDCLTNAFEDIAVVQNRDKADSVLSIMESFKNISKTEYQNLLNNRLIYAIQFGSNRDIDSVLQNYNISGIDINVILSCAYAYYKTGKLTQAKALLDVADASGIGYDTLRFQSIAVRVHKDLGNIEQAFSMLANFNRKNDSIHSLRFIRESQLIEHKHRIELQAQIDAQHKMKIIWLCIGGLLILGASIIILLLLVRSSRIRKDLAHQRARTAELENEKLKTENANISLRAENLAHRVEMLENESESLKNLISSHDELPPEVEHAIQERIEMLNALLAGYITDNDQYERPYDTWVKELTDDTEAFMNTNRLAFQASHPRFIRYFEDHGLTTDEINYVCLYAIGLRGKEVGNYIKKRSHVNISSAIRRKLGIDRHETNIGIYVRKLLKNRDI